LLGLTLSVGTLLWVDLRLLGVSLRHLRVSEVYRRLAVWFGIGFLLMFASGAALFTAFATAAYVNLFFRIKMVALLLAALNAVAFHLMSGRATDWDAAPQPPVAVQLAGLASLLLWITVILAGRAMSYTMFSPP
jgi:multidrug transporter EmrE-like cation transporter